MWKRETKLGLVVSGSFLCLLGVMVGKKLLQHGAAPAPESQSSTFAQAGPATSTAPVKQNKPASADEPQPFPIKPTAFNEPVLPGPTKEPNERPTLPDVSPGFPHPGVPLVIPGGVKSPPSIPSVPVAPNKPFAPESVEAELAKQHELSHSGPTHEKNPPGLPSVPPSSTMLPEPKPVVPGPVALGPGMPDSLPTPESGKPVLPPSPPPGVQPSSPGGFSGPPPFPGKPNDPIPGVPSMPAKPSLPEQPPTVLPTPTAPGAPSLVPSGPPVAAPQPLAPAVIPGGLNQKKSEPAAVPVLPDGPPITPGAPEPGHAPKVELEPASKLIPPGPPAVPGQVDSKPPAGTPEVPGMVTTSPKPVSPTPPAAPGPVAVEAPKSPPPALTPIKTGNGDDPQPQDHVPSIKPAGLPSSGDKMPVIGAEPKVQVGEVKITPTPLAAQPVIPGAGSVKVTEYPVETYQCEPDTLTFAAISAKKYRDASYGQALLQFNRSYPGAVAAIMKDPPELKVGQAIAIPPLHVLQSKYPGAAPKVQPVPVAPGFNVGPPVVANKTPTAAAANVEPTALGQIQQTPAGPVYTVKGQSEFMIQIAQKTLGNGKDWSKIWHLNTQLDPSQPVPVGTQILLPKNGAQ